MIATCNVQKIANVQRQYEQLSYLNEILQIVRGRCEVKITFQNMDLDLLKYMHQRQQYYRPINLEFEYPIFEENFTNNNNNRQRVAQIFNPDNENEIKINEQPDQQNQCIYQFQQQQSNGITGTQKLLMFHQILSYELFKFIQKKDIHLTVRVNDHSYHFTHNQSNQELLNSFFEQFKKQTDQNVFLIHQCQSQQEAYNLFNCFVDDLFISNFSAYINVQKKNIQFNITNHIIRQRFNANNNYELMELAQSLINENIFFIILTQIKNHGDTDIKNYQDQLEKYLSKHENLKKESKIETFTFKNMPNMEIILKELKQIQKNYKYQQLTLGQPEIDSISLKFKLELEIRHWLLNGKQINLSLHNQIKEEVFKLFVGSESLQLKRNQIKTWQNILQLKYEKIGSNQDVQVKTIKEQDRRNQQDFIIIELRGNRYDVRQIMDSLKQEINQYEYKSFSFKILEQQIISNIKKIKESKAFSKKLKEIEQNNSNDEDISIQFDEIKTQDQYLAYLVTYNQRNNLENLKDDLNKFSGKLQVYSSKTDTKELLDFLQILTLDDFEEQYQLVVIPRQYNYQYIGEKSQIDQLKNLLDQVNSSREQQFQKIQIKIKSNIVWNQLKIIYSQKKIDNLTIKTDDKMQIINLIGLESKLQELEKEIKREEKIYEQRLITQKLELKPQEIKYLYKSKREVLNSLVQKENCEFQVTKKSNEKKLKYHIQIGDKNFYVIHGDIIKSEGDCVVNSCNNQLTFNNLDILAGVARSISEKAGMHYVTECKNYILRNGNLPVGGLMITNAYNLSNFKYIINVNTPIYNQGASNSDDLKIIQNCIKSIIQEARNKGCQSIVFPVLGGGGAGHFYDQIARIMINTLLQELVQQGGLMGLFRSNKIKDIYLIERNGSKIFSLIRQLEQITTPAIKMYEVKYQWQWQQGDTFNNYDDWEVNKDIDEAYDNYKNRNGADVIDINFPFSKIPGTHIVDFNEMQLTDKALHTIQKITEQKALGMAKYHLDGVPQDDSLSEFLHLQKLNGQTKFDLFLKKHRIVFSGPNGIVQRNIQTGYERKLQAVQLDQNYRNQQESLQNQNPLAQQQYQKTNYFAQDSQNLTLSTQEMSVTAESRQIIQKVQKILKEKCEKSIKREVIVLPRNNGQEYDDLLKIIVDDAVKYEGNLQPRESITVFAFRNTIDKIQIRLQSLQNFSPSVPQEWVRQTQNFIKIHLQQSDKEYITVQQSFSKTYQTGRIYAIYRIQNKKLYQNYIDEKLRMLDKNQDRQIALTTEEEERLVWHGTRNSHPKVLYEGMQEAFDNTFSNVGMWGQGIYFAENALYSVAYSHQIQDNGQYLGKKVMLCCKLATGKVIDLQPNNQLRRPPFIDTNRPELGSYDCVSGFTNDSKVYILYSMDVRRAYPAYEVIYE